MKSLNTCQILKTKICIRDYDFVIKRIKHSIKENKKMLVFPLATHTLVLAYFDKQLQKILNSYSLLALDSQWIRISLHILYGLKLRDRVYGPEIMKKTLALAEKEKYPIYLYGNTHRTLLLLIKKIKKMFPAIVIAGYSEAPFIPINQIDKKEIVQKLNRNDTKIVFFSLSSPKQVELAKQVSDINNKNLIYFPVGAVYDFVSGVKKQAPIWMQDNGLEWLFRLWQEPYRLGWRYLSTGSIFILLVILQKIKLFLNLKRYENLNCL